MKKLIALFLVMIAMMTLIPCIALADGPTVTDTYMPVMADQATPEPVCINPVEEPIETDPGGEPIDLTPIIQALITLMASWITLRVIPWLKAKTTERQYSFLLSAVSIGVSAAENLFPSGEGAKKFEYVCSYLRRKGFAVDEAEIEAMVWDRINQFKAKTNQS